MNFKNALAMMKMGCKVKLPHWGGYWAYENGEIIMHTHDKKVLRLLDTDRPEYTFDNMASDNFIIANEENTHILKEDGSTKVYIAGSISNNPHFKEQFGFAECELKSQDKIALNPATLPAGLKQEEYMKICIPMLYVADEIYMLEGWEVSVGATIEHNLAKQAGKKITYQREERDKEKYKTIRVN